MAKKIGVLLGGRSAEREVSLRTGDAIYQALTKKGYHAVKIDIVDDFILRIQEEKIELAFLALHGPYGEDGTIPVSYTHLIIQVKMEEQDDRKKNRNLGCRKLGHSTGHYLSTQRTKNCIMG